MQTKPSSQVRKTSILPSILVFIGIVVVLVFIAFLNAPTMGGPKVMASFNTYLNEVRATAIPFMIAVGVLAMVLAFFVAREVRKVWPNKRERNEFLTGYLFLAPYLLITLTFTIGVILFALYISFNNYDIFTRPTFAGLSNYAKAFEGFTDSTKRDFLQSLYNVLWYSLLVVPIQTSLAILLAVLLNAPMHARQWFRTIFYAPSVTSSVVITLIFVWFYLKDGYVNYFIQTFLGWFGVSFQGVNWLGDPRGLIQLIVEAFGGKIPSTQWYLRGPSIAWMAVMVQNIFTTIPTFMIMFLAALQDINPTLYEAARIDGANNWQVFRKITLPLLKPITLLVVVLGTIGTLQVFDQVYLATKGGPLKTSLTPVFLIFQEALGVNAPINMGYATALAFILAVIIFIFTFIQRRMIESGTEQY
ncbi:MAG TPA: sugar ABC transporter permease [Anaerolineaceae bacterium]|jgi:multiple sugar transport system permease protein|nr:sugar ABC transporter permease [Anaerolineaceae bacterium]